MGKARGGALPLEEMPDAGVQHIKKASPDDVAQLVSLEKKCFKKADMWRDEGIQEAVAKRNTLVIVARTKENEIVGCLFGAVSGLVTHVTKLAVLPNCRRRGLARAMLRALCSAAAREKRAADCTLYVDADNEPAVRLYASEGFVVESRLEDYYAPGRHALKMRHAAAEEV